MNCIPKAKMSLVVQCVGELVLKLSARKTAFLMSAAMAIMLAACGGGSGGGNVLPVNNGTPSPPISPPPPPPPVVSAPANSLSEKFHGDFLVGGALNSFQIDAGDLAVEVARMQFNTLTPEYQLKADVLAPTEGVYDFTRADQIVNWALENGMEVRGHALVWHEATPAYFYEGTPEEIRARLEAYVTTVVTHFRGRVKVWDVVNEATSIDIFAGDNGIGPDRPTDWYEAVGSADYIDWAFRAARAADPDALLFLNDYETENPIKRAWFIEIAQRLIDRGVPIDGVGHQMHLQPNSTAAEVLAAIDDVDNQFLGLINHITELDMSAYDNPGECWVSQTNCEADFGPVAPPAFLEAQARLMRDLFNGFADRPSVESVTTWGVLDDDNWLNFTPVERNNFPLLFDANGNPKPAYQAIIDDDYVIVSGD